MSASSYILTTVVTAAETADLSTVATVMDDWQIDKKDTAFIGRTLTRCSVAASQFCNRDFGVATYSNLIRLEWGYRDGYLITGKRSPIMLPQWPLVSVSSVTETPPTGTATTLVEGTDYEVDYTTGNLYRLYASGRPRDWDPLYKVVVVTQAGYVLPGQNASDFPGAETLPVDIEDAVGRMVFSRYSERRRDPLIKSETVDGVGKVDYIVGNPNSADGGNMSPDVADILNNYRVPVTG